ncbi:hypothetical protein JCM5353_004670, partial [Sporobolomyces roseus]
MDRSFGASSSTATLLATPTPLDRKSRPLSSSTFLAHNQLAQSINSGNTSSVLQPLSFQANPSSSLTTQTTKAVRFSPAHPSTTGGFSNGYSTAPSSRVQSIATPPRNQSSPSLSALKRSNSYGLGSGAVATPPRQQPYQQLGQQISHQVQQKVQSVIETPKQAAQEIKQKLEV